MSDAVLAALISSGIGLIGIIITGIFTGKKSDANLRTAQAVMETELKELTREVRKHNNFAERIPVLEEQVKVVNHRIEDLEKKT